MGPAAPSRPSTWAWQEGRGQDSLPPTKSAGHSGQWEMPGETPGPAHSPIPSDPLGMGECAGPGAPSAVHQGLVQMPLSQPRPGPEPGGRSPGRGSICIEEGGSQRTTTGRNVRAGMGLLRRVPRFSHMSWAALVQFTPMGLLFHFILLLGYFTLAGGVISPTLSS